MKDIRINPKKLSGNINIPSSKSISHRAIISALLSNGKSIIKNVNLCDDVLATIDMARSFGAEIEIKGKDIIVDGGLKLINNKIDCRESGSTLRFSIPFGLLFEDDVIFTGKKSLLSRPISVYEELFKDKVMINESGITVKGVIEANEYEIDGSISSQFISGLLFVLPLQKHNSTIKVKNKFESKSYVLLTIQVLNEFGIDVELIDNEIYIKGNQVYKSCDFTVEADYSQAAFFLVANEIGSNVEIDNLNYESIQGDKEILAILSDKRRRIDASNIPDLVPILSVYASLQDGEKTTIYNASRLRIKESDRLMSTCNVLKKLGADIKIINDTLEVYGKKNLNGGEVDSWNDHRIAMSVAIASTNCINPVVLKHSEVVKKSYPTFWNDYKLLGGDINE